MIQRGEIGMSRKLPLTQKQITAICKGAAKAGFIPVIEANGLNVRLIPKDQCENGVNPTSNGVVDDKIKIRF